MKRTETKKFALASLFCALSAVLCAVGCLFDMVDLCACTAASVIIALSDRELGGRYPYLVFAASSALLLILFPTASATVYYILFFGYYPLLRRFCERFPRLVRTAVKFAVFNAAIVLSYFLLTKLLLSAEAEESTLMLAALWITANIFFAVFDFAMSVFMLAYDRVYRKKWGIDKFMMKR